jgi:hypothetical protein
MWVKAQPGERCPRPGRPKEYITDGDPVEVPDDVHHLRLVKEGSLVEVSAPAKPANRAAAGQAAEQKKEG